MLKILTVANYLFIIPSDIVSIILRELQPDDLARICQFGKLTHIFHDVCFHKQYFQHWYNQNKLIAIEYLKQPDGGPAGKQYLDRLINSLDAKNEYGFTALMEASIHGYIKIVAMLLAAGADVNAKNIWGETALMLASNKGHKEIVQMLIDAGADVNAREIFLGRNTALMFASENGHQKILQMLIDAGADVNAQNDFGNTALIYASFEGHKEIVAMLLAAADVNARGYEEITALMHASGNGHKEIVRMLLAAGADVNAQTYK